MKTLLAYLTPLMLATALLFAAHGCSTRQALNANSVVIVTVDSAMKGWAAYTQTHTVPDAQILAVSNAYVAYYNTQLIASNVWIMAVSQTNYSVVQTIASTVAANQTNLLNIINVFTKGNQ